jgi:nucleolin
MDAALAQNNCIWPGTERWLHIQEADAKKMPVVGSGGYRPEGCDTVYVANMSYDIDEETLRETFGECGEIVSVRLAVDQATGKLRGFGHIQFADGDATDYAVSMTTSEVMGRAIRVDYAPPRVPGGKGKGGGRGGGGRGGGGGKGGGGGRSNTRKQW